MAGEIQLNSTTFATESGGAITVANVDSATNRTNLGLGSIATQNANAVALTGGSLTGTEIDLKSSGTTLYASDGSTAVLSESSGTVSLGATVQGSVTAWARITATASGSETIANGFGISSIARQAQGQYRIGFSSPSPVSNTNYMVFGNVTVGTTGTAPLTVTLLEGDTKSTSEFDIYVGYAGSSLSTGARDYNTWREIHLQVIGV